MIVDDAQADVRRTRAPPRGSPRRRATTVQWLPGLEGLNQKGHGRPRVRAVTSEKLADEEQRRSISADPRPVEAPPRAGRRAAAGHCLTYSCRSRVGATASNTVRPNSPAPIPSSDGSVAAGIVGGFFGLRCPTTDQSTDGDAQLAGDLAGALAGASINVSVRPNARNSLRLDAGGAGSQLEQRTICPQEAHVRPESK